jgi:hypothetical protein
LFSVSFFKFRILVLDSLMVWFARAQRSGGPAKNHPLA